tara:strand:- start:15401 stop:17140 length:1740 start_codon:yes stop_codon:yes gene_type:complete
MNKLYKYYIEWLHYKKVLSFNTSQIFILILLGIFSTFFELIGITLIVPIISFFFLEEIETSSKILIYISNIINFNENNQSLFNLLIITFFIFFISRIFLLLSVSFDIYIYNNALRTLRVKLFNTYLDARSELYDNLKIADFANSAVVVTEGAVSAFLAPIRMLNEIFASLVVVFFLLSISANLTIILFIILIILVLTLWFLFKLIRSLGIKHSKLVKDLLSFTLSKLKHPRLIKLSNNIDLEKKNFREINNKILKTVFVKRFLQIFSTSYIEIISILVAFALILYAYKYSLFEKELLMTFLLILTRTLPIVKRIITTFNSYLSQIGFIEKISILNSKIDKYNQPTTNNNFIDLEKLSKISFENVSYSYDDKKNFILKNINCEFTAGYTYLITGRSGAGKSTLIDLITSFRVPSQGIIKYNNIPLESIDSKKIYIQSAFMPQEIEFIENSIINHINYGNLNINNENLIYLSRLTNCHDFISKLPDKFNTTLNLDKIRLSGGEKRRLDLLRALIKEPKLLILDEPTANLDNVDKENFYKIINKISKTQKIITIVISHDINNRHLFDKVYKIDKMTLSNEVL